MSVAGFAELTFAINNPGGPIEIGAETEYEVTVTNTGSMADCGACPVAITSWFGVGQRKR